MTRPSHLHTHSSCSYLNKMKPDIIPAWVGEELAPPMRSCNEQQLDRKSVWPLVGFPYYNEWLHTLYALMNRTKRA